MKATIIILKLLQHAKAFEKDYELWSAWLRCVASALWLEDLFTAEIHTAKKQIVDNLDGFQRINSRADVLLWCSKTYDVYHKLRNNVETLDSVEVVRVYLKENNKDLNSMLKLIDENTWTLN